MLYKKNKEKTLSKQLFENPTSEYRGAPFWAWNCKLEKEELCRQIEIFKKMGIGGFHMHVRTGMATPYLSDEYMDIVKACVDKAKHEDMLAWLYDEDRWPSGSAGGLVTKDEQYRARYLLFTPLSYEESSQTVDGLRDSRSSGGRNCGGTLIGVYDVVLDGEGCLVGARRIDRDAEAEGEKWYAYVEVRSPQPWFNNQAYVDTLNKKAIERFIEITHERYKQTVGDDFGGVVPAIFTDEPQFTQKRTLNNSLDKHDVTLPWTDDFAETYSRTYGEDIMENLPELFWERADGSVSVTRYRYHDHIAERFTQAFADTIGAWCRKNGIALTGHMMEEPTLKSQTAALGEAMRSYRGFDIPGIDMLCANFELTTAKQAQSACRQHGNEGVLSELYGVTGWDYDFRGHKLQGDWQAALGVSVRVHHLTWVSMAGEAKRDYPASIGYQSPWYEQYSFVEDHFARVAAAMTRGKPDVRVGVIHPIESYWLHWGPNDKTALRRETMDRKFLDVTSWLLNGSIDFDFICESQLPLECESGSNPLRVGCMEYDAVVVPDCETLRSTTLDRLEKFIDGGGRLIFMGSAPDYADAIPSDRGKALFEKSERITFDRYELLTALEDMRSLTIRKKNGALTDNLIYQLRRDSDCDYLFVAHSKNPYNKDIFDFEDVVIELDGEKRVSVMDTISGKIYPADTRFENSKTYVSRRMYDFDSLLLKIEDGCALPAQTAEPETTKSVELPDCVDYSLDEPNVMLLDMARFKVDDSEYFDREEILRADNKARRAVGIVERVGGDVQPWVIPAEECKHSITLEFTVEAETDAHDAVLALENAEQSLVTLNGETVDNTVIGWYVDKSIKKIYLGTIKKGVNVITVKQPLGERTDTECCYLLGDFGVKVTGRRSFIVKPADKLYFGDVVNQGLAFYGGNITYHLGKLRTNGVMRIMLPQYSGAVAKVLIDKKPAGYIAYSPNTLIVDSLEKGEHEVDIVLYTNRYNCFGAVHNADAEMIWQGPGAWRSEAEEWTYEYRLRRVGILTQPVIETD